MASATPSAHVRAARAGRWRRQRMTRWTSTRAGWACRCPTKTICCGLLSTGSRSRCLPAGRRSSSTVACTTSTSALVWARGSTPLTRPAGGGTSMRAEQAARTATPATPALASRCGRRSLPMRPMIRLPGRRPTRLSRMPSKQLSASLLPSSLLLLLARGVGLRLTRWRRVATTSWAALAHGRGERAIRWGRPSVGPLPLVTTARPYVGSSRRRAR